MYQDGEIGYDNPGRGGTRAGQPVFDYREEDGYHRGRFRLGGIGSPETSEGNPLFWETPACATIDEFCVYGRQGDGGADVMVDEEIQGERVRIASGEHVEGMHLIWDRQYSQGRYYNQGDGTFTQMRSFEPGTRFLKMAWTTLMPEGEYNPALREGQGALPGIDQEIDTGEEEKQRTQTTEGEGSSPQWRILLDFFDGEKWLLDVNGDGELSREEERRARFLGLTDEGGVPLEMSAQQAALDEAITERPENSTPPDGMIRYRAYFKEDADWLTTPLLESPVLDDVTITYVPPGGPRTIRYSEGR